MNPGDRLGHYTVVAHLGSGGMGAVFRATDTTLGRDVALKVLPRDVAADAERLERFQREARAIAALNHPNIITIYSVEQVDGVHFLTMELVTGQPLDRLIDAGLMPIPQVETISREIAEAVAAAHDRGVIHRDLKPANVMLTESGRVKVLDFGLAKMRPSTVSSSAGESETNLVTEMGVVLGTPAYMSPEQVSGLNVDHRTDVFSFGILLYELATGLRPFRGRSPADVRSSILRDAPRPVAEARSTVPPSLARVIARCLEKDVSARFSTMGEVARTLGAHTVAEADAGPSVAVLPFQNLSADSENEFFGDGLAEEILNALSQVDGLRVAARTSSFSFKGRTAEVAEIGAKLRVSTVLDGSVRRSGNRVRVTVQLVDTGTGFQRWSERYDREMADIFDVQDEIARAIADKLKVTLTAARTDRIVRKSTESVEAYELYLRGRALLLKRGRHVAEGTECLKRAVAIDPGYAAAWSGLADSYTVRGYWGSAPPGEVMPKALSAARRAVTLDPELAEGHNALAMALMLWERDFDASASAFRRCLELNPGYTQGRCWYGLFQLQCVEGRVAEGMTAAERALEADPLSAYAMAIVAFSSFVAAHSARSLEAGRRAAQMDPESLLTHWVHGLAAHVCGEFDEALAAFRRAESVSGGHQYPLAHSVQAYAESGRMAEARTAHARLLELASRSYVSPSILALAASAVGDMDQAIDLAQQACDERDPFLLVVARVFPHYRRVRENPRFADVLRRLKLP